MVARTRKNKRKIKKPAITQAPQFGFRSSQSVQVRKCTMPFGISEILGESK